MLSPDEISVLEIGWNFSPRTSTFDKNKLAQDLFQFVRRRKLKEYFCEKNGGENSTTITLEDNKSSDQIRHK